MTTAQTIETQKRSKLPGIVALICIGLQVGSSLWLSLLALVLWVTVLYFNDIISLKRLWIPRFWLATLIMAMLSGFILGPRDTEILGVSVSAYGLEAGGLMIVRGAFIFGLMIWASRNLNFEHLKKLAMKFNAERLIMAVEVALRLIPVLSDRLGVDFHFLKKNKDSSKKPMSIYSFFLRIIVRTARFADQMAEKSDEGLALKALIEGRNNLKLIAITGLPGTGKTSTLEKLVQNLRSKQVSLGGIIQLASFENENKTGYKLVDVANDDEMMFARKLKKRDPGQMGYEFDQAGWAWAKNRIDKARTTKKVVFVDELGRLEARGKGHIQGLLESLDDEKVEYYIFGVRENCLTEIEQQLGRFDSTIQADTNNLQDRNIEETVAELFKGSDIFQR